MPGLGKNAAWILTIILCSFVLAVEALAGTHKIFSQASRAES